MRVILATLLLTMVLVACTSQEPTQQPSQDTAAPAETPVAPLPEPEMAIAPETPTASPTRFKTLMTKKDGVEWMISYNLASDVQGQSVAGTMTQYLKSAERMRTDMEVQGTTSRTYLVNGEYTSCFMMGGGWTCRKIDIPAQDKTERDILENEDKYTITEDGTKTVIGIATTCYAVAANDGSANMRYCLANDGAPLYIESQATQDGVSVQTEMTATSYEKSVADSDFVIPAAAESMTTPTQPTSAGDACAACASVPAEYRDQCLQACGG